MLRGRDISLGEPVRRDARDRRQAPGDIASESHEDTPAGGDADLVGQLVPGEGRVDLSADDQRSPTTHTNAHVSRQAQG